jgi:hypothetical protein
MLDHEGVLALFRRQRRGGTLALLPGSRVFLGEDGEPLVLSRGRAGKSGRRKLAFCDWDGDGDLDLLADSKSIDVMPNLGGGSGTTTFGRPQPLSGDRLAGHTTSPAVTDWDRDGVPDLLVGAEDGRFYALANPRRATRPASAGSRATGEGSQ